jgi:hypothetical protein
MAITTLDGYIAATKQNITHGKTASRTAVAGIPFSVFDLAGFPGAGVLAGTSTTAGVVPTDATAGTPTINAFGGGATGYLSGVSFGSTVACRIRICDLLWKAGAYPFNAAVALSLQPSYAGRVPGGTDFKGTEMWLEAVTAFTGNQSINITYTNQDGTGGRSTGTIATGTAPIVGRMFQLPLQSGDSGVQRVDNVTSTVSTVGTFNVLVLRPLWEGRVASVAAGDVHDLIRTRMPQVFADSALYIQIIPDSTATGIPSLLYEVANG